MDRSRAGFLDRDQPAPHQLGQRLLERVGAVAAGDRDLLVQVLQRVLAHLLPGAVAHHQQLGGRHAAAADLRQQHLGHHRGQRHRQLLPDGRLALGGKRVGHARHRRGDIARVHRREHQVAGLARRQRDAHRLGIAHLADHDHVRRLPHRRAQRGREVGRVDADFNLLDDAALVQVLVLDRILDGDDVPGVAAVDHVDQRGDGGGLAGSGGAADQHQPVRQPRQRVDARRQPEVGELRRVDRQGADAGRGPAALAVQVDPEAAVGAETDRGVRGPARAVVLGRVRRQRRQHRRFDLLAGQHRLAQLMHRAVHADRGGEARDEVEIAGALPAEPRQPRLEPGGRMPSAFGARRVQLVNEAIEVAALVHGLPKAHHRTRWGPGWRLALQPCVSPGSARPGFHASR